jgi:hypothetical protein
MDVHKETVVVCVLAPDGKPGEPARKIFGTFRNELTRMRGWLKLLKVTEIAMESTGVYFALSSALIGRVQVPPALR